MKRIAVLMGGWSPEREVSLSSGASVVKGLEDLGHKVFPIDVSRDLRKFLDHLDQANPDIIFNTLHGEGGEDGIIQGVCEMVGIPYTYSGVLSSSVAMDKAMSKKIFAYEGLPVPEGKTIPFNDLKAHPYDCPYVLKPIDAGSSVGVKIIHNDKDLAQFRSEWTYGHNVLCEKFIPGRDIQVAYLGGKAIGAIEVCSKTEFYDYKAKYTPGFADHLMPCPISPEAYERVLSLTEKANEALGCRGLTRTDFRYDEANDTFYVLEVNTQPGMTPISLCAEILAYYDISFKDMLAIILSEARCDRPHVEQDENEEKPKKRAVTG